MPYLHAKRWYRHRHREATLERPREDARDAETLQQSLGSLVADARRRLRWQRRAVLVAVYALLAVLTFAIVQVVR